MGAAEWHYLREAYESNWIAPVGPCVDEFERRFASYIGLPKAAALSSGTAALHLALRLVGVKPGDEVFCSDFTFIASASPIIYEGARPVFIDSELESWNMDPDLLDAELTKRSKNGRLPKAVILVHLYGQPAQIAPILASCARFGVPLIEDAAESLGSTYREQLTGTFGQFGAFSFNGNKIITTSGGGMLVSRSPDLCHKAKYLATQARQPVLHYEHLDIGFNYRLSNLLAAIGMGQMEVLVERIEARRKVFSFYKEKLESMPGLTLMPELPGTRSNRWLTCIVLDEYKFGESASHLQRRLESANIESRPLWKPMHLQPVFHGCQYVGRGVAKRLFSEGLCLPSGSNLSTADLERIVSVIRKK